MAFKLWGDNEPINQQPDKETTIRNMAGHSGTLESAASAAPDSTTDGVLSPVSSRSVPRGRRKGNSTGTVATPTVDTKAIEDAEKLAKRRAALQKISEKMMEDMAGAPYEMWAALTSDDDMKLSEEERKDLGEAYRLVAESLPMGELPSWITLSLFICGRNAVLVRKRVELMGQHEEKKKIEEMERKKRPI